jgi:hypothetical protein
MGDADHGIIGNSLQRGFEGFDEAGRGALPSVQRKDSAR